MSLETSSRIIQIGLLTIVAMTTIIFLIVKLHYQKVASSNLTEKNKGRKWRSPAEARVKYPEVDTFRLSGSFRLYGIMVALILMIFAFSWTTYENQIDITKLLGTLSDEIEMETPRTAEPPPPPPPPPSAVQLVASDLPDIETTIFVDQSIDEGTAIDAPIAEKREQAAPPPPPPPPPPMDNSDKEIFKVVEESPTFPGCEAIEEKQARQKCAEELLLQFIYKTIQYPEIARENGVEGMVVIKFVVEKDGSISNKDILRDVGAGCGEEAMRVVSLMPNWNPGKQRGNPVRVQFTLPVKFDLQ
ncbi:MAG: energy transducer TonB [Bacteroidetes bacterium]|nr:energy transducer TonB [Bacteroidota bacterium]